MSLKFQSCAKFVEMFWKIRFNFKMRNISNVPICLWLIFVQMTQKLN